MKKFLATRKRDSEDIVGLGGGGGGLLRKFVSLKTNMK